jgi:hypothetical protein
MGQQGFRTTNNNPYVYQEIDSGVSVAYGVDTTTNLIKIVGQSTIGAQPIGVGNVVIDPSANGNITFNPNGTGKVVVNSNFTVTSGAALFGSLVSARPSTVRASPSGQLSTLIDSNVNGQVLISATGSTPVWASLTQGPNVTITPGANSITISAVGAGLTWTPIAGASVALTTNAGFFLANAGLTTATLPATANAGDIIRISGTGTGLFVIAQNAGQSINFGNVSSTIGVLGSVASTMQYDAIEIICTVANSGFAVLSSVGNFHLS